MPYIYIVPKWFFTYSIAFELLFTIVTLAVAYYALKVHKIYKDRASKIFGLSFILFALSYFSWVLVNLFLLSQISETYEAISLTDLNTIGLVGVYSYMIFHLLGTSLLSYLTLKTKKIQIFIIMLALSVGGIMLSYNKIASFYIASSIFLLSIIGYYIYEYIQNKNKQTLIVLLAFVFLLITNITFLYTNSDYYFVTGHILDLIAYALILINLILIKKHEQKKK